MDNFINSHLTPSTKNNQELSIFIKETKEYIQLTISNFLLLYKDPNFNIRSACANLIFELLIIDDKFLSITSDRKIIYDRIFYISSISITLEKRMNNYFKYEDYCNFSLIKKKIMFFLRGGDLYFKNLKLTDIADHPFSNKYINVWNIINFTGFGYIKLDDNRKMYGYLKNGWFVDYVRIYKDGIFLEKINYEDNFNNYLLTLID